MFWLFFQLVGVVLAIGTFCFAVVIIGGIAKALFWLIAYICFGVIRLIQWRRVQVAIAEAAAIARQRGA